MSNNTVEGILSKETKKLTDPKFCFVCGEYLPVGTECVVVVSEFEGDLATVGMHQECSDFNDSLESI